MTKANPTLSEIARQLIIAGTWRVDPAAGHIYGQTGKALRRQDNCGYVKVKFPRAYGPLAVMAHRVIWEYVHGPLDPALTINHRNGIKTDNRIENLEAVTVGDNVRHAVATGLRPGRKGETAPKAKLTDAQVIDIHERCKSERVADLAREYGVAYWTISSIKHARAWKHITCAAATA